MKKSMLFLICILFINNVNALSIKNVDNVSLKKGSIVTYNIDLGTEDNGELSYDQNVFEALNTSSFKTNVSQSSDNTFLISGAKNFNLTLKVKSDVLDGNYQPIILKSNNDKVEQEVIINKEITKDFFKNIKTNIPYLSPLLIIAIGVSLIIILYAIKKIDGSNKNVIITIFSLIIVGCLPLEILLITSKDNKDDQIAPAKVVNYKLKYVEEKEEPEKQVPETTIEDQSPDNLDNNISTNDTNDNNQKPNSNSNNNTNSNNTPDSEKPISVVVHDVNYNNNYVNNSGSPLKLELNILNNQDSAISFVVIDNTKYPVKKLDNNKYELTITAPTKAGLNELVITELILANDMVVSSDMKIKIDVLKTKPTISAFKINNQKEIPEVSFKVNDNDNAFTSGIIKIVNNDGKVIYTKNIQVGENVIPLKFTDNSKYHVNINISYDLDSDYFNDITGDINEGNELLDKDFTFTRDYNFVPKNVNLSAKVSKNEQLVLTFLNDYASYYDVKKVVIDGVEYEVTKKGKTYQVVLDKKAKGLNYVNFEKVILENSASIEVGETLTYLYLKEAPSITKLETALNANKINSKFTINDIDDAVTSFKAILTKDGNIIATKELAKMARDVNFEVAEAGNYQVKIIANYDLGDKVILEKNKVSAETLNVPLKSAIVNISNEHYIANNSDFKVTIEVADNTLEDVTSFTIAGKEVKATKLSTDKYEITLNSTSTYGNNSFNVENINYNKEKIEVSDKKIEIYTLKNMPKISNIVIDTVNLEATYQISHLESFISGEIVISKDNDDSPKKISINKDSLTTSLKDLNLSEFVNYKLQVIVNYDLDDDVNNNLYNETIFEEKIFEIKNNYNFRLTDLQVKTVTTDTITLTFKSTNASNDKYHVKEVVLNGKNYKVNFESNDNYTLNVPVSDIRKNNNREIELIITKATLTDEHSEEVTTAKTTAFKELPTAEINNASVIDSKNIKVSFTTDNKKLDVTYQAKMVGEDNSSYEIKEIDASQGEVTFTNATDFKNQKYTIVITATFDAKDGINYVDYPLSNSYDVTVPIYVTISSLNKEPIYVKKNDEVILKYQVTDNTTKTIDKVKINDEETTATIKDNILTVVITAPSVYGSKTYQLNSVQYQTTEDYLPIAENHTTVSVLKDVPSVSKFNFDDANNIITFNFENDDGAVLANQKVTITKDKVTKEYSLNNNDNTITLDDSYANGDYIVSLSGTYDLGYGQTLPLSELFNKTITVVTDYELEFEVANLEVTNNEAVTITFTSSNASKYNITKIKINDDYYPVQDNKVVISYTHDDKATPKTFTITDVILKNNKELSLKDAISLETYKAKPTANVSALSKESNNHFKASYNVNGDVNNLKAKLMVKELDSTVYKEIATKELTELKGNVEFTKDSGIYDAGDYKIEIFGDFNLVDGLKHQEEQISDCQDTVAVPIVITGVTSTVSAGGLSTKDHYPVKGSKITLEYDVIANTSAKFNKAKITTYNDVKDINNLVNGSEETIEIAETNGQITKTAPKTPGVVAYKINAVYYKDTEYPILEEYQQSSIQYIDVLKDELAFKNVQYTDNYVSDKDKSVEVEFDVLDKDKVLDSCEGHNCFVQLKPLKSSIPQPEGQVVGSDSWQEKVPFKYESTNKIVFRNLVDLEMYMLVISADYNTDSTLLTEKYGSNYGTHTDAHREFYFISKPADIELSELKVLNISDVETSKLKQNENFKLSFKAKLLGDKTCTKDCLTSINVDGVNYAVTKKDDTYITDIITTRYFTVAPQRTIYINGVTLTLDDGTEEYIYIHKNMPSVNVEIIADSAVNSFMLPTKIDFF